MQANFQFRAGARAQLQGKWGISILVFFLYGLIFLGAGAIPVVGPLLTLFIGGPLVVGCYIYALHLKRGEQTSVSTLFEGFNFYGSSLGLFLWNGLWIFLWSLLLIIPGIIKSLSYSMSFFILADNPSVGVRNALNISKQITYGYKGPLFLLYLSFIGWGILASLTLGIGYLWLMPYIYTSLANFYDDLKNDAIDRGILTQDVFSNGGSTFLI